MIPTKKSFLNALFPLIFYIVTTNVIAIVLFSLPILKILNLPQPVQTFLSEEYEVFVILFSNVVVLFFIAPVFMNRDKKRHDNRFVTIFKPPHFLALSLAAIGMHGIVSFSIYLWNSLTSPVPLDYSLASYKLGSSSNFKGALILQIIAFGFVGPCTEEILTRGITMNRLKFLGSNKAVLLSALIFSILHFPMGFQMAYTFMMGIFLGFVYIKFQKLIAPILCHIVFNLSNYLYIIPSISDFFIEANLQKLTLLLTSALAFFCLGLVLLKKFPVELAHPQPSNLKEGF
jgi:membrane protease YdiL (CAAX protease family)